MQSFSLSQARVFGLVGLVLFLHGNLPQALALGIFPFILGDTLKVIGAVWLYRRIGARCRQAFGWVLTSIAVLFICLPAEAEIEKAGWEHQQGVRVAVRSTSDEYDFYLTRTGAYVDYHFAPIDRTIRLVPFFEYQVNLDRSFWWRREAGLEAGSSFFNALFYYGASFQHIWQKPDNYAVENLEETTEWESRFVFTPPIKWWIFGERVKLRLLDEYTYDFNRGQFTFNDVAIMLDYQLTQHFKIPLGWRHTDRIHDFDSDMLECSLLFTF